MKSVFLILYLSFFTYTVSETLFSMNENPQFNLIPMNVQESLLASITTKDSVGLGSGYISTLQYQNGAPISGEVPLYIMYQHTFSPNSHNTPFILFQIGTTYSLQMDPTNLMSIAQNPMTVLSLYNQTYYKFGMGIYY